MYATLKLYRLNPIFERDFIRVWHRLKEDLKKSELIQYGVLHKESKISYLSYIHWRDKDSYQTFLHHPSEEIRFDVQKLEECCNHISVLHRMSVLDTELAEKQ